MTTLKYGLLLLVAAAVGLPSADSQLSSADFPFQQAGLEKYIIGGKTAESGQFPYQAKIYHNNEFVCGGALLSRTHVLTAAHCVNKNRRMRVVLGAARARDSRFEVSIDVDNDRTEVSETIVDNPKNTDVAVIKLNNFVYFSEFIRPVKLPDKVDLDCMNANYNLTAYVTGWGKYNLLLHSFSKDLRYTKVQVAYKNKTVYQEPKTGPCSGDYGGPLVFRNRRGEDVIIGFFSHLSYGSGDEPPCTTAASTVYVYVEPHLKFIKGAVKE